MFLQRAISSTRSLADVARRCISQTPQLRQSSAGYTPNALEKRFLVWSGRYKSLKEVPSMVTPEIMERSRNKMRIRIANIMMGLTIVGCGIMIYSGKEAAKRGETVAKQNLDWHKQYNEKYANKETKE